jgi:hypothetical protein
MAKHSHHILALARRGAEHRYEELKTELASLLKHFPDLTSVRRASAQASRSVGDAMVRGGKAVIAATSSEPQRKRRTMSAKARKAIGDAQRKRWAAKKKADAVAPKKSHVSAAEKK